MKIVRSIILVLWLGTIVSVAQETATAADKTANVLQPARTNHGDLYHLDATLSYRRPWNGDYEWVMPATISFGKMLNDRNALDAVAGIGVIELKHGSPADARAHQPFFVELGIAWRHYFAPREAAWKPYFTAGASLLWMTWEYRHEVDSKNFGFITRDYLEGADGYAGVGLSLRLRKHLNCFGEVDVGGVGFLSTTYSGEHNDLFQDFGYVGFRGGLSLCF